MDKQTTYLPSLQGYEELNFDFVPLLSPKCVPTTNDTKHLSQCDNHFLFERNVITLADNYLRTNK